MDNDNIRISSFLSFDLISCGFITWLVFLILKVTKTWNISWFWVWFPFWLPWAIAGALYVIAIIIILILVLIDN